MCHCLVCLRLFLVFYFVLFDLSCVEWCYCCFERFERCCIVVWCALKSAHTGWQVIFRKTRLGTFWFYEAKLLRLSAVLSLQFTKLFYVFIKFSFLDCFDVVWLQRTFLYFGCLDCFDVVWLRGYCCWCLLLY